MKKFISIFLSVFLIFTLVGCGNNTNNYSESDFVGTWMTQENIEKIQQMSNFERTALQGNVSSLRICESNAVRYTPTSNDGQATHSYKIKGDSIVVSSTYTSFGNSASGKKTYEIISTDNGYELESNGKRYIKICDDPYVYDVAEYLE